MAPDAPAHPGPDAGKDEWRRWAAGLPAVPQRAARATGGHLRVFLAGIEGPVLAYLALGDEVDLGPLPRLGAGPWALPRLGDAGTMTVHLDDGRRERHRLGVDQPPGDAEVVDPSLLGAVLVPGRVFDRAGYRLGRGGGHYDRFLAQVRDGTPVVGTTVAARLVDRLPRQGHDVPMTHLATEDGVRSV